MRDGLSRRDMIKGAAAAGAAVWTAPMIIDSLTSPAAAASGCSGSSVTLSWIYILYRVNTTVYLTGFTLNSSTCASSGVGSNTHGTMCCAGPQGISLTLNAFNGGFPTPGTTEAINGGVCPGSGNGTWTTEASCGTHIVFSGGQIVSQNGAEILAAIGFGGGTLRALCPTSSGTGNSVCGIEL
jgi:hypothetical protein